MSITTFVGSEISRAFPTGVGLRWIVYCWFWGGLATIRGWPGLMFPFGDLILEHRRGGLSTQIVVDPVVTLVDPAVLVVVESR